MLTSKFFLTFIFKAVKSNSRKKEDTIPQITN